MNRKLVVTMALCAALSTSTVAARPSDVVELPFAPTGTYPSFLAIQPDGRMLVGLVGTHLLWRLHSDGRVDTSFGQDGTVQSETACQLPVALLGDGAWCELRRVFTSAGGAIYLLLDVHATGVSESGTERGAIVRLTSAGAIDTAYGSGGLVWAVGRDEHIGARAQMALAGDGTLVVAGTPLAGSVVMYRLDASGSVVRAAGAATSAGGTVVHTGMVSSLQVAADGSAVVAGSTSLGAGMPWVVRVQANGQLDPAFVSDGLPPELRPQFVVTRPDGSVIVGASLFNASGGLVRPVVAALGRDGRLDPRFGSLGAIGVPSVADYTSRRIAGLMLDSRGRIVVVAPVIDPGPDPSLARIVVARLRPDGSPDTTFSAHGHTTFWSGFGSGAEDAKLRPDDAIVVAATKGGRPFRSGFFPVWRYPISARWFVVTGGDGTGEYQYSEAAAVEYASPSLGHYFVTAIPREIALLDVYGGPGNFAQGLPTGDWTRTGRSFRVWTEATSGGRPVCRFFSGARFAPRSSHFYSPYASECEVLQAGQDWTFEGTAFWMAMPQGGGGAGNCSAESRPLYRAYNNGMTGAPNHRYTDDPLLLDQLIAQGWIMEGEAQTRVFACVPR